MSEQDVREFHEREAKRIEAQRLRHAPPSAFVKAMQSAMQQYLDARAAGVSREDACKGIEEELRAAWPKRTSKFAPLCSVCDDTGYEERTCTHAMRCGRSRCEAMHPAWEHLYVVPCVCPVGDKKRKRLRTDEDAMAAAVRTAKAKKPSRFSER